MPTDGHARASAHETWFRCSIHQKQVYLFIHALLAPLNDPGAIMSVLDLVKIVFAVVRLGLAHAWLEFPGVTGTMRLLRQPGLLALPVIPRL